MRSTRRVALLRGVNLPGAATRLSMADLRLLFEGLGCGDVRTVLNSGNVVFTVPGRSDRGFAGRLDRALAASFGLTAPAIVLTADQMAAAVEDNPLAGVAENPSWLLVVVPRKAEDLARLRPLLAKRWAPEQVAIGRRAAYLWCANGVARSPLWTAVDRALEGSGTARNIRTMTQLAALVEGQPARGRSRDAVLGGPGAVGSPTRNT